MPTKVNQRRNGNKHLLNGSRNGVSFSANNEDNTTGVVNFSRTPSYYDASSVTRSRDYGGFPSAFEDVYFNHPTRAVVIGRLRREVRNNPFLAGLVGKYPEAIGFSTIRSRTGDRSYNDIHDNFWDTWSERVTASGESLRQLEGIIYHELLVTGEAFLVMLANGLLQMIPSEFCGSSDSTHFKDIKINGKTFREINGVLYNEFNLPRFYRFGKMNDFGMVDFQNSTVVEARNVVHIWSKDRIHMGRGLPWLVSSIQPARDLAEIMGAKVKQIKDASSISGTIESEQPQDFFNEEEEVDFELDDESEDLGERPADFSTSTKQRTIELKDGTFVALAPGEKLNMLQTQYNASDYKELVLIMLHSLSSPVGLPVELWFSGLGDVNYSGFKGLGLQWDSRRTYIVDTISNKFLRRIHFWRVNKARRQGILPENPDADDSLISIKYRRTAVLDAEKVAKQNSTRLKSGEVSLHDIWDEQGFFTNDILQTRRQLWIKLLIASGRLNEDDDTEDIKVPMEFLLNNKIPENMLTGEEQENNVQQE